VMGRCETGFVHDHGEKIAEVPPGVIQADERVIEAYFDR
jgi:ABC-type branched-subunit amino acid transport system ATPase component